MRSRGEEEGGGERLLSPRARARWRGAECASGLGPPKQRSARADVGDDGNSDDADVGVDGDDDDGGNGGNGDGDGGGGDCDDGGDGDGGGGDGFPRTLPIWPGPWAITPRDQISREGNPSLRQIGPPKGIEVRDLN